MEHQNPPHRFTAYYINLTKRPERAYLMKQRWDNLVNLNHIEAVDYSEIKQGVKGCFKSHKIAYYTGTTIESDKPFIIMEDDIIPCKEFEKRLLIFIDLVLPKDWDILMVGHSVHDHSKYTVIDELVYQANTWVGAGHCYIVNPKFKETYRRLIEDEKIHEHNFDILLNYIEKNHKVYMAIPSLCYQYQSYSDNSNMLLDNTKYTETFFKK